MRGRSTRSDAHLGYKSRQSDINLKTKCCFLARLHQLCVIQRLLASGLYTIVQFSHNVRLVVSSDAAVRFGPVQRTFCLNLEPDLWFGSSRLLNLGLDLEGPVQQVRFG
jgi:hypothetical protein